MGASPDSFPAPLVYPLSHTLIKKMGRNVSPLLHTVRAVVMPVTDLSLSTVGNLCCDTLSEEIVENNVLTVVHFAIVTICRRKRRRQQLYIMHS